MVLIGVAGVCIGTEIHAGCVGVNLDMLQSQDLSASLETLEES